MSGRYANKFRELHETLGPTPLSMKRYSQIGQVLLDVYVRGFFPDNQFNHSWENPPNPYAHASNLADWYFKKPNQKFAHFKEARQHVLEHMHASVREHFPDCGEKQLRHIEEVTLKYFYVDSRERFNALLSFGATEKKAMREYFGGVADAIIHDDPSLRKKGGRGYYIQ